MLILRRTFDVISFSSLSLSLSLSQLCTTVYYKLRRVLGVFLCVTVVHTFFPGGSLVRNVPHSDTYFNARVDKTTKAIVKMVGLNGTDFKAFVLKAVVYKLNNGIRMVNPEIEKHLDDLEKQIKEEYQEKQMIIEEIRGAIYNNNQKLKNVQQCGTKAGVIMPADNICPYCDRDLKIGPNGQFCTCTRWREHHGNYGVANV